MLDKNWKVKNKQRFQPYDCYTESGLEVESSIYSSADTWLTVLMEAWGSLAAFMAKLEMWIIQDTNGKGPTDSYG